MIQSSTILNVIDNSGARKVKCLKILGGSHVKTANIGDIIVVSIKKIKTDLSSPLKIKKGDVCYAIVVRTKKAPAGKDGAFFRFTTNAVVLLDKNRKPIGTRASGIIIEELRRRHFIKTLSLSSKLY